jgi:hypothetical protein
MGVDDYLDHSEQLHPLNTLAIVHLNHGSDRSAIFHPESTSAGTHSRSYTGIAYDLVPSEDGGYTLRPIIQTRVPEYSLESLPALETLVTVDPHRPAPGLESRSPIFPYHKPLSLMVSGQSYVFMPTSAYRSSMGVRYGGDLYAFRNGNGACRLFKCGHGVVDEGALSPLPRPATRDGY